MQNLHNVQGQRAEGTKSGQLVPLHALICQANERQFQMRPMKVLARKFAAYRLASVPSRSLPSMERSARRRLLGSSLHGGLPLHWL